MEAKRVLLNKKSLILLVLLFSVNLGIFYHHSIRTYEPAADDEIQKVDFSEKYERIKGQIREFKGIAIFQDERNGREEEKTLRDYGRIASVRGETSRTEGIHLWFEHSAQNVFAMVFCLWIIFQFFDSERKGLFPLIYAAGRGRLYLALCRLLCCFAAAFGGSVLFHGPLLIVAALHTKNTAAFFEPVQFVRGLETCVLPLNGMEFAVLAIVVSACGIFVAALLFWMFLLMIHNSKIALTVCGVLFVAEYYVGRWIPEQSRWALLKYVNIMTLLDVKPLFPKYYLYTAGTVCMERKEWLYFALLAFGAIFSAACLILACKRRPYYEENRLEKVVRYFFRCVRARMSRLPGCLFEWYKMLVPQKGFWIVMFFFMVLVREVWQPLAEGEQLIPGDTGEYMKDFYDQWEGPVTDEVYGELAVREQQVDRLVEEGNKAAAYYSNGLREVYKRLSYIEKNKEQELWLVNPSAYRILFGRKGEESFYGSVMLVLLCMAALIAGIFSYEKKCGMECLLATSPGGREQLNRRKYVMVLTLVLFFWLVLSGMECYNVCQSGSPGGFGAPVQSLPFMKGVPFPVTVFEYCLIAYFVRLIWMSVTALVYIEICRWCKNQETGMLICSLPLVPSALYLMGMDLFSALSVTKLIHVSHFFRQGYTGIAKETAAFFIMAVLFFASYFVRRRKYAGSDKFK